MIVGHAFVAFALAASLATRLGVPRARAVAFGLVAGGFAVVPDVDMAFAVVGLLQADPSGIWSATAAFWDSSQAVHRAVTHSLVLAVPAALGFALAAGDRRARAAAVVPLGGLVVLGWAVEGPLGAAMLLLFGATGAAVAATAARYGLGPRTVGAAALVGLVSHPFGDLFTGTPPPLAYPLGAEVFGERVVLLADPTLNLLAIFGFELAAIWLGVAVAARHLDWSLTGAIDRWAAVGAAYGVAAFVLPPPTLETSYHFVFSVLAVGGAGAVPLADSLDRLRARRAAVTGLAAVTLGWAAYVLVFLVV